MRSAGSTTSATPSSAAWRPFPTSLCSRGRDGPPSLGAGSSSTPAISTGPSPLPSSSSTLVSWPARTTSPSLLCAVLTVREPSLTRLHTHVHTHTGQAPLNPLPDTKALESSLLQSACSGPTRPQRTAWGVAEDGRAKRQRSSSRMRSHVGLRAVAWPLCHCPGRPSASPRSYISIFPRYAGLAC